MKVAISFFSRISNKLSFFIFFALFALLGSLTQAQSTRPESCFAGMPDGYCFVCTGKTAKQCAQDVLKQCPGDFEMCSAADAFIKGEPAPRLQTPPSSYDGANCPSGVDKYDCYSVCGSLNRDQCTEVIKTGCGKQQLLTPLRCKYFTEGQKNPNPDEELAPRTTAPGQKGVQKVGDKTYIPFGPIRAEVKINSKTGQKETCNNATTKDLPALKEEVLDKFGVDLRGNWQLAMAEMVCNKFAEISGTKFFDVLHHGKSYNLNPLPITMTSGYDAHNEGSRAVFIGPAFGATENFMIVFTHEVGHALFHATPDRETLIAAARAADQGKPYANGSATKYGDYDKPPAPCTGSYATAANEDFAETVAYYLNPGKKEQTPKNCVVDRIPFADKSSAHYKMMNELLGDFE